MVTVHPEYVVDAQQNRKAVLLPAAEWDQIVGELEELDDIRAYDAAQPHLGERLPFELAVREVQQDCARALANLSSNEENHTTVYRQGGLQSLVDLTTSAEDVCQRYAAMGLRFLASNPEVRVYIVKENMVAPFLALAESPLLEYQRTAATMFSLTM